MEITFWTENCTGVLLRLLSDGVRLTLGVFFGILEALGETLGGLGGSLGLFFGILDAPWGTFSDFGGSLGDLVAPNGSQYRPLGFGMQFGLYFGRFWGA